jgi:threonine synthase
VNRTGEPPVALACAGCGRRMPIGAGAPVFRCPDAGDADDVDHVLRRELEAARVAWPVGGEANPFLRFRGLLSSWHAARARGARDEEFVARVERLDAAVAALDGRGFRVTPLVTADRLAARLGLAPGQLLVKDETGNVAGSHKGRHLMGVLLHLDSEAHARVPAGRLAIASCGNAALAAGVVARAAGRALDVFVPTWADERILARLAELGATVTRCARRAGERGDPCYRRFRAAVAAGAVPFCCQGPDNGLTIEGGATLAWEIGDQLGGRPLDRLFVQVGGGALASACALGFADAVALGQAARAPRLHAVQTAGAAPLVRAYDRVLARVLARLPGAPEPGGGSRGRAAAAEHVLAHAPADLVRQELGYAATHRGEFMWPWESEPRSVATGILDDETYDWLAIVESMLRSGGWPLTVDEQTLAAAEVLGRETTGIDADATGTAGLAGLLAARAGGLDLGGETVALLATGVRRA